MRRYPSQIARLAAARSTVLVNANRIGAASVGATAAEEVTAAISGDLINASPVLAAKLEEFNGRLEALETPV